MSITGVWDAGYKITNAKDNTADKKEIAGNNAGTSRLILSGTEDLGGGLKAQFKGQALFSATTGQTGNTHAATAYGFSNNQNFFNDELWVGLSGDFGAVKIGTPDSAQHQTNGVAQPFGTAMGGGWASSGVSRLLAGSAQTLGVNQFVGGGSANGRIVRAEKSVRYDTPVFSGVSASYAYAAQNDQQTDGAKNAANSNGYSDIGVYYNQGPVKLSYANTTVKAGAVAAQGNSVLGTNAAGPLTAGADLKATFLAGNYTIGALTVYAGATTAKTTALTTNIDTASTNFAAKYALTPVVSLAANTVKINDKTSANKDQSLTGLGLDYALSKRTNAYVRAESFDTDKSVTTKGVKTYAIGVLHTF